MFQTILIGISILVISSIAYVLFRAYRNGALRMEMFQSSVKHTMSSAPPMPEPAPPIKASLAEEPPRVVVPSGPNPPNAAPPAAKGIAFPPETKAHDPFDEVNGETPMRDSMRHPERSFGPGVENSGTQVSLDAGISSQTVQQGISSFSPEFAQNGGEFMSGVMASDAWGSGGDTFATA